MKITVNRKEFRKAFVKAASNLPSGYHARSGGVLLSPRNGDVLLSSSTEDLAVQTTVKAKCELGPNALLPAQVKRAISAIDAEELTLELLDKSLKISGGAAVITIKTPDPEKYPELPAFVIDGSSVEIDPTLFRRAIKSTWFATRSFVRSSALTLQCVNIIVSDRKMTFTSTDGTRIARFVADVSFEGIEPNASVLMHPLTLKRLYGLTKNSNVTMCLKNDSLAVFSFGDGTNAAVPLTIGTYPNLEVVFATFDRQAEHYETVNLKTADLAAMLSKASIMSTRDHQVLRLSLAEKRLWSEIRTPEIGEARCSISAAATSDKSQVTLDVQLLRDGMAALYHNEKAKLSLPDQAMPIKLFTDNYTYVVMPYADNTQQQHAYNDAIETSRVVHRRTKSSEN